MPIEVPLFAICLILSAFFSGSETALLSSSRLRLRRLAHEGDRRAAHILDLVSDPRKLLATILVGNNVSNVLAASIATAFLVARLGSARGVVFASALSTVLLVLFSEFLPKTVAASHPLAAARRLATPVRWAQWLLYPLVLPLEALSRPLGALLRRRGEHPFGLADVRMAVMEGVRSGAVDATMARVLQGGLSLTDKTVGDVLVPRVDVSGVDAKSNYEDCLDAFRRRKYSRLLVMDNNPDNDLGYLAARDLTLVAPEDRAGWTPARAAREALRVPATLPLPDLLVRMRRSGVHFAVVKDEYGGTEGIATLEDVLEELVGEIRDEHDEAERPPFERIEEGVWLVRADVTVDDVDERLGLDLPAEEARTIGGFLAEALGRVPKEGDVLEEEGARLTATRVRRRRVLEVRVEKTGATPPSE